MTNGSACELAEEFPGLVSQLLQSGLLMADTEISDMRCDELVVSASFGEATNWMQLLL